MRCLSTFYLLLPLLSNPYLGFGHRQAIPPLLLVSTPDSWGTALPTKLRVGRKEEEANPHVSTPDAKLTKSFRHRVDWKPLPSPPRGGGEVPGDRRGWCLGQRVRCPNPSGGLSNLAGGGVGGCMKWGRTVPLALRTGGRGLKEPQAVLLALQDGQTVVVRAEAPAAGDPWPSAAQELSTVERDRSGTG